MRDLELESTDDLVAELQHRFAAGCIIMTAQEPTTEDAHLYYWGGKVTAIGCAEYASHRLRFLMDRGFDHAEKDSE